MISAAEARTAMGIKPEIAYIEELIYDAINNGCRFIEIDRPLEEETINSLEELGYWITKILNKRSKDFSHKIKEAVKISW